MTTSPADNDAAARYRSAKILATIGPASDDTVVIRQLIDAGVAMFRLNMSHGDQDGHRRTIARIREVCNAMQASVGILVDLCGPKIRSGRLEGGGPVTLCDGDTVEIVEGDDVGTARRFSSSHDGWIADVDAGGRILIDDGIIELVVESRTKASLTARVVVGGELHERRGINLPGARLSIPSLTERDLSDLAFALEEDVDWIALSFVRSADDVRDLRARIDASGRRARVMSKIEKQEAIEDLDAILDESDGVLVARGDLGVETSVEAVPVVQKLILDRAHRRGKVSVTATQMLQSMIEHVRPTRAEASDVANAVLDGSDGLLLTGETAIGKHPVAVIQTMDRIIRRAETPALHRDRLVEALQHASGSYRAAIAHAAAFAAREMGLERIVVFSVSGTMARHIAALRPDRRIIALTPRPETQRQLAIVWGITACVIEFAESSNELVRRADQALIEHGLASEGEEVILMAGRLEGRLARAMKVHRVSADG